MNVRMESFNLRMMRERGFEVMIITVVVPMSIQFYLRIYSNVIGLIRRGTGFRITK